MVSFSERMGIIKPKDTIQREQMDAELRNDLWNLLYIYFLTKREDYINQEKKEYQLFFRRLWIHFLKRRLDEAPNEIYEYHYEIKRIVTEFQWNRVYDLLEFILYTAFEADIISDKSIYQTFNKTLQKNLSAYRFIDGIISEISSSEETEAIETAINDAHVPNGPTGHIKRALELFSDRTDPDYRNSIKESISSVESYCRIIIGKDNATLGKALKELQNVMPIHQSLQTAFGMLYGYTSDEGGIRHANVLNSNSAIGQEEARYMLVSCSAFLNYLRQKEAKLKKD